MKQINFNNYRDNISQNDADEIFQLLCSGLRSKNRDLLHRRLSFHLNLIPHYGILERLIKDETLGGKMKWIYCAGQSYPDEIKTVRNIILNLK